MERAYMRCCRVGEIRPRNVVVFGRRMGADFFFLSKTAVGGNIWAIRESEGGLFDKCCSEPLQLTAGPMLFGAMVASHDGKKLFVDGFQPRGELVRYDLSSR